MCALLPVGLASKASGRPCLCRVAITGSHDLSGNMMEHDGSLWPQGRREEGPPRIYRQAWLVS